MGDSWQLAAGSWQLIEAFRQRVSRRRQQQGFAAGCPLPAAR